ncbi:acyltransferase family protein [Rhizobiales bacterium RZME27]|uniref:Acyltransferase family protein n=1 Tax=Endobacterium cereale TaxID=2663029 RepID=A0A6A8AFE1_9HYPH|nr:acyltransferase family protein [Endobacterium cereale]MEB2844056.1 acyltransferase family protein [Endobacterium cereale]MQY48470.1 acyltransferase family protein [Endobacterium cereale]
MTMYRPEIDGLRAIAVLSVVLSHANFAAFSGGFIGVDVFFVISGYLITRIILGEYERGRFSLVRFYERRAKRILPALFFVALVCLPFAWLLLMPSAYEDFSKSLIATAFSVSNFYFWKKTDYFATESGEVPLLHTWSLGVEEQYYMLFPLLFLWRFRVSTIFRIVAVMAVCSLAFSEWGARAIPSANYYLLPGRAWEILAGSLCAFYAILGFRKPNGLLAMLGLVMIVVAIFLFEPSTRIPSLMALLPVVGAALVLLFSSRDNVAGKILSQPALVFVGKISFSAYLWHQPVFAFWRINSLEPPGPMVMIGLIMLVFVLAMATWTLIEQPFRHNKASVFRVATAVIGGALAFVAIGLFGVIKDGVPSRLDPKLFAFIDTTTWSSRCLIQVENGLPTLPWKGCMFDRDGNPEVAIWGDSIGSSITPAMVKELGARGDGIVQLTHGHCAPILAVSIARSGGAANCDVFNQQAFDYLLKSDVKTVVLAASWVGFFNEDYLNVDGREQSRDSIAIESVRENLSETIGRLQQDGKKVLLLYPGPRFSKGVADQMAAIMLKGDDTPTVVYSHADFRQNTARAYAFLDAVEVEGLERVWPEKIFCDTAASCTFGRDGTAYVADRSHFTRAGASLVATRISGELFPSKIGGSGQRQDIQ